MPKFSERSLTRISTCDPRLICLFRRVVETFDCTIIEGHRTETAQNTAFANGTSKLKWPDSLHNARPSMAVDAVPFPINWEDRERFHYFAGYVKGVAEMMRVDIRWGGDWDSDTEVVDNRFDDLAHFELKGS